MAIRQKSLILKNIKKSDKTVFLKGNAVFFMYKIQKNAEIWVFYVKKSILSRQNAIQ